MAKSIDGKKIALEISDSVKEKIEDLQSQTGFGPKLVSLTIGGSEGSEIYVNMQKKIREIFYRNIQMVL